MPPKSKKQPKAKPAWVAPPGTKLSTPKAPPPKMDWPPLTPLLPASELELETTLAGQIVVVPNFFTAKLCKIYVEYLQRNAALTTTPGQPKRGEAVRVNDRFQIQDAEFAERLWNETGLREIVERDGDEQLWGGKVVGLNPNIRIYRYGTGQFFDKHYDDSNEFSMGDPPEVWKTTWTLLIYLTGAADGVKGGETVFYTEATKRKASETVVADLVKGTALLHKHGKDCMLHEGRLVEDDGGVGKWVLRSDLCVKRR